MRVEIEGDALELMINIMVKAYYQQETKVMDLSRELENLHQDIARFHEPNCDNWNILVANCCENNDVALNAMDQMLRARKAEKELSEIRGK